MRRVLAALALLLAGGLVGAVTLVHPQGAGSELSPTPAETSFGARAPGSSAGVNATNASATVTGTLLSTTTSVWWLNNTHATLPAYARISVTSSAGLTNLAALEIGIHNGTSTPQATLTAGTLLQPNEAVRLEPGSANAIYVTRTAALGDLGSTSVGMIVRVADDAAESAYVTLRASLVVT